MRCSSGASGIRLTGRFARCRKLPGAACSEPGNPMGKTAQCGHDFCIQMGGRVQGIAGGKLIADRLPARIVSRRVEDGQH